VTVWCVVGRNGIIGTTGSMLMDVR